MTTNIKSMGYREFRLAADLFKCAAKHGLPDYFYNNSTEISLEFNSHTGEIFFANERGDIVKKEDILNPECN